jgi:dTDP-4-amino-4,6-dideoxygalactose transaminase
MMLTTRMAAWPTLPLGVYLRRPRRPLPYPLDEPNCRIFPWGRVAIYHGVRALGLGPGDQVLAPAYHHGSEIEALLRAGLGVRFYECDERLRPDEAQLASLLAPEVRALHLTHYLGFPQDCARWRRWCDERGLLLIEDAAQAWLSTDEGVPVGKLGDVAIFCLYKTVGISEGAALVGSAPPEAPALDPRWGVIEMGRRHANWLAERSRLANALTTPLRRSKGFTIEREVDLGDAGAGIWRLIPLLLPRICDPDIAARRRANYQFLLEGLREHVPEPFAELPAGASPFAFPIETDRKRALLERLAADGVYALDLWSTPHPSLEVDRFPDARRRRQRTVGLPVHQELGRNHLERMLTAVRSAAHS